MSSLTAFIRMLARETPTSTGGESMSQPYIMTGTVGERWPVKVSNMAAYDVDLDTVGLEPCVISTKDSSDQEFMVAVLIPEGQSAIVIPKWAFGDVIDESQIMVANSPQSIVSHNGGDFIVASILKASQSIWNYLMILEIQRKLQSYMILEL